MLSIYNENKNPILKKIIPQIKIFKGYKHYFYSQTSIKHYIDLSKYSLQDDGSFKFINNFYINQKINSSKSNDEDKNCNLHFLSCGAGDSCIIENCGEIGIIDLGAKEDSVVDFLSNNYSTKDIKFVVISHLHSDHLTDFKKLCEQYNIENLYILDEVPNNLKQSDIHKFKVLNCSNAKKLHFISINQIKNGEIAPLKLGNATFEVIGPTKNYNDLNQNSLILKMNYHDKSVLFTGDTNKKSLSDTLNMQYEKNVDLKSDILKVPHHGGSGTIDYSILNEISPTTSIISAENKYSHPKKEIVDMLDNCSTVYVTREGNIDAYLYQNGSVLVQTSQISMENVNYDGKELDDYINEYYSNTSFYDENEDKYLN